MAPKKKNTQTRLAFKAAVASSSPPAPSSSATRISRSKNGNNNPDEHLSAADAPSSSKTGRRAGVRKARQVRLDDFNAPLPATFLPKRRGKNNRAPINVDTDESAAEIGDAGHDEDVVDLLPPVPRAHDKPESALSHPPGLFYSDDEPSTKRLRSSQSVATRLNKATLIDDDDDVDDDEDEDEDGPPPATFTPSRRFRPIFISLDDSDDSPVTPPKSTSKTPKTVATSGKDTASPLKAVSKASKSLEPLGEGSASPVKSVGKAPKTRPSPDEKPVSPVKSASKYPKLLATSGKKSVSPLKSAGKAPKTLAPSDEEIVSPTKKRKLTHPPSSSAALNRTPGRLKRPNPAASSSKKAHKGHRTEKQKKMELLRRRRAGEKIDKLTSSESSSDEDDRRGLYDSDTEGSLVVLKEFDDEEEECVQEKPAPRKLKNKREKARAQNSDETDLDDFVTDDDEVPLGVPMDIPLEFTSHAHKPLKEQFPYVIEWLVHNRINPAFERRDPIYVNAWRKLDDEVYGLANSKFISSIWRPDFLRALKSRPQLESFELSSIDPGYSQACEACGRSGHPSTSKIILMGTPYHKDTLLDVESDSDSDDDDNVSVDTQGMPLPPTTKGWAVGSVCCDNATIAHSLLHWKHALKEWVEERLEQEGWMTAEKLRQRETMKPKKRRLLANSIVDEWQEKKIVNALYGDFKHQLETARTQETTGRQRGRYRQRA